MTPMDEDDFRDMLINPYNAITIHPDLATEHPAMVTEAKWIEANLNLIDEMGTREWLGRLLAVLQGGGPRNPDEVARRGPEN